MRAERLRFPSRGGLRCPRDHGGAHQSRRQQIPERRARCARRPPAVQGVWASVTHATPLKRDVAYDHRTQQAALDIEIHHTDGRTRPTPDQVELYAIQFEQIIAKREQAGQASR